LVKKVGRGAKNFGRKVGRGAKNFGRKFSGAMKDVGRKIGKGTKSIGKKIGNAAKKVGKGIGKAAKKVYDSTVGKVKDIINKAKKLVSDLKKKFSKAEFKGEKVCISSNRNGDKICLFDGDMIAFVRNQPDLSSMMHSRQFTWEKLIGVEILNLYLGVVGYAGTKLDCQRSEFDIALFARGAAKVNAFGKNIQLISVEGHLNLNSNGVYVRILGSIVYQKQFFENYRLPCSKIIKPLVKPYNVQFFSFSFTFVIFLPFTVGVSSSGTLGVELHSIICPKRLTLTLSIEPYVVARISGSLGVGVSFLQAGVKITFYSSYRLKPSMGTANCNLCVVLGQRIEPANIMISAFVKAIKWKKEWTLYQYKGDAIEGNLYKLCSSSSLPYNPEQIWQEEGGIIR